ncbi:hypothetical protein GPK67_03915 [Barnesiella intestinihominis]|uniref:hypothetical protein n=1 Tax=Barnesiella intestinihominis TaxID=487174 RepID=UPI001C017B20|nr:hypothetical protein [Barnesiella intestinihominis]MBT9843398.1 hypothetical protein [Barnesiella intestinihominis]
MKNKLLLVSCALFLFSGTAFAENLLVTKTSGGADEEGTLPYVVRMHRAGRSSSCLSVMRPPLRFPKRF